MIQSISYAGRTDDPHGYHYAEWRFHLDSGEVIAATLDHYVPDPARPGAWRYYRLGLGHRPYIEWIGAPLELWLVGGHAAFSMLTAAAEYALQEPVIP
jgi:hypothetical protein